MFFKLLLSSLFSAFFFCFKTLKVLVNEQSDALLRGQYKEKCYLYLEHWLFTVAQNLA